MSDIDTARHELKRHGLIADDAGNVAFTLDDGRRVFVGVVAGDDVYFPRLIGTVKTWPIASITSAADWHGDGCVLIHIVDKTDKCPLKIRLVQYSHDPTARPPPPAWPHGLTVDDSGVVIVAVPYPEPAGIMARVGRVEVLPPGRSIVFDDPVRRGRAGAVRQRLYVHEIIACAWDHEINGVYVVDRAGRIHRYRATDFFGTTPAMIARDPETLRAVDWLFTHDFEGRPKDRDKFHMHEFTDCTGLDRRTARAVLMELCHDDVLDHVNTGAYDNYTRYRRCINSLRFLVQL